ncbi:MAG: HD-GYP domain-containing protein [Acidimicrobiia bacterium]
MTQSPQKVGLAAGFFAAGAAALIILLWTESFPAQWWIWALFAVAFVTLEWRAVEINDRLFVSSSPMVALTAAVVFGKGSAALGVALMAAFALLHPVDIRERRWLQPLVNFGQLVLSAAVAVRALELVLPDGPLTRGDLPRVAVGAALAALVYDALNFRLVAFIVKRIYQQGNIRPWSRLFGNHLSFLGMGFLGGLLGATYLLVGSVTLPLIFAVFIVGHLTFVSYAQLREAQEATLRGFVKALEAKDLYTRGHTERVAYFAQLIGEELGYTGTGLEQLRWAALIHDVGKLAVPRELIRKSSGLTGEEYAQMQRHVHVVEDLLAEVEFLQPMVQIASGHHARYDGNGYGGTGHTHGERPSKEAGIVAVADAFDAMTSSRSYRAALTQEYAFAELRRCAGTQFDPQAVEALIGVLEESGEVYGSPDIESEEEARRLTEERAIRG